MITEGHLEVFSKFSSHRVENKKKCFDENFIMDQCVCIDNGGHHDYFQKVWDNRNSLQGKPLWHHRLPVFHEFFSLKSKACIKTGY